MPLGFIPADVWKGPGYGGLLELLKRLAIHQVPPGRRAGMHDDMAIRPAVCVVWLLGDQRDLAAARSHIQSGLLSGLPDQPQSRNISWKEFKSNCSPAQGSSSTE